MNGKKVASAISSHVNARILLHECVSLLHEVLLMPILLYSSETMVWREKERFRIRAVWLDNL